jgi:hypothetical protein
LTDIRVGAFIFQLTDIQVDAFIFQLTDIRVGAFPFRVATFQTYRVFTFLFHLQKFQSLRALSSNLYFNSQFPNSHQLQSRPIATQFRPQKIKQHSVPYLDFERRATATFHLTPLVCSSSYLEGGSEHKKRITI